MRPADFDESKVKDLGEVLPDELFNHPDCFNSQTYWVWEREIAGPALEAAGFKVGYWWDEDRDSFGPLIRAVTLTKDGVTETYTYG